ncbi:katanin p60 ATPase-containing subunit A-like 2 [Polyodon spathula]|uniref:katanin p60 ATPase-containing subunit A-like 2 n=1 Tax=Polyodon spathula TaxID=7913 RepID=UPI001B7E9832|nr:katanin p60 ATPase-containing subunit A-like 2 [Polyodon spathula]
MEESADCDFPLHDTGREKKHPRRGGKLKRTPSCNYQTLPRTNQPQGTQRPPSKTTGKRTDPKTAVRESPKQENGYSTPPETAEFDLIVSSLSRSGGREGTQIKKEHLIKPVSAFSRMNSEMRELAAVISRDIYLHNPNVRWDDIIGLDAGKRLVKEAVLYPIKYPQLFTGILSPWKGLLLDGPQGK